MLNQGKVASADEAVILFNLLSHLDYFPILFDFPQITNIIIVNEILTRVSLHCGYLMPHYWQLSMVIPEFILYFC